MQVFYNFPFIYDREIRCTVLIRYYRWDMSKGCNITTWDGLKYYMQQNQGNKEVYGVLTNWRIFRTVAQLSREQLSAVIEIQNACICSWQTGILRLHIYFAFKDIVKIGFCLLVCCVLIVILQEGSQIQKANPLHAILLGRGLSAIRICYVVLLDIEIVLWFLVGNVNLLFLLCAFRCITNFLKFDRIFELKRHSYFYHDWSCLYSMFTIHSSIIPICQSLTLKKCWCVFIWANLSR